MNWTTQKFRALVSWKTSLMAGKPQPRLKMEMFGKCHRGKKIFSSKNLIAELHIVNFRCAHIVTCTYFFLSPCSSTLSFWLFSVMWMMDATWRWEEVPDFNLFVGPWNSIDNCNYRQIEVIVVLFGLRMISFHLTV